MTPRLQPLATLVILALAVVLTLRSCGRVDAAELEALRVELSRSDSARQTIADSLTAQRARRFAHERADSALMQTLADSVALYRAREAREDSVQAEAAERSEAARARASEAAEALVEMLDAEKFALFVFYEAQRDSIDEAKDAEIASLRRLTVDLRAENAALWTARRSAEALYADAVDELDTVRLALDEVERTIAVQARVISGQDSAIGRLRVKNRIVSALALVGAVKVGADMLGGG